MGFFVAVAVTTAVLDAVRRPGDGPGATLFVPDARGGPTALWSSMGPHRRGCLLWAALWRPPVLCRSAGRLGHRRRLGRGSWRAIALIGCVHEADRSPVASTRQVREFGRPAAAGVSSNLALFALFLKRSPSGTGAPRDYREGRSGRARRGAAGAPDDGLPVVATEMEGCRPWCGGRGAEGLHHILFLP